jgi:menaquinol-cytochrome c reductase iron-sulfur subunit
MQKQSEERQIEQSKEEREVTRRTFLSYVNVAIGGFITALLGIPLIGAAVIPALRRGQENLVSAGPVSAFNIGEPKAANVTITIRDGWITAQEDRGVWVVRRSENDFSVFNGRCVHLGCAFSWNQQARQFQCPCHGGLYTLDGQVVGGPPPRPLDTMEWRVDGGNLVVNYKDFRLGVPEKEEI